jgi:hypothetical protein
MTTTRSAGRAGALLLPIALLIAACGGTTASGSAGASTGSNATVPPAASTQPEGSTTPGSSPAIAFPSFDIGSLATSLANVDSYKVTITEAGADVLSGVVLTKPVAARDLTLSGGARVVIIGDKAWMAQGGGALTAVPETLASGLFAAFDPTLLLATFSAPQWAESAQNVGKEQKNGIQATHYHIDSTTAVGGFTGVPAGATIDLWIADEGYLVAFESKGLGSDMSIEVTNVNDPANKVDQPS